MPKDVEMGIINVYTPLNKSGRLGDLAATRCHGYPRGSRWVLRVTAFCVTRVH